MNKHQRSSQPTASSPNNRPRTIARTGPTSHTRSSTTKTMSKQASSTTLTIASISAAGRGNSTASRSTNSTGRHGGSRGKQAIASTNRYDVLVQVGMDDIKDDVPPACAHTSTTDGNSHDLAIVPVPTATTTTTTTTITPTATNITDSDINSPSVSKDVSVVNSPSRPIAHHTSPMKKPAPFYSEATNRHVKDHLTPTNTTTASNVSGSNTPSTLTVIAPNSILLW
jgi:hypothetical protein